MLQGAARAYVYAKACGVIGKSFVGNRIASLSKLTRLADLDRLIFPEGSADLPEKELLQDLERRITERNAGQIVRIASVFDPVPEILTWFARSYEYADLKNLLNTLAVHDSKAPRHTPLGRFSRINYDEYPDLKGMLGSSEFSWIIDSFISENPDQLGIQTELDQRYYTALWKALLETSPRDRRNALTLISEEISLKNISWALRLHIYYGKKEEEILPRLIDISYRGKSLTQDAMDALGRAPDLKSDWDDWNRKYLLNDESPGEYWNLNPRYVQNACALRLYRFARLYFRRNPFSLDTVCCFIKLKQFEEDLLISVAEGLTLGMPVKDLMESLEVHP